MVYNKPNVENLQSYLNNNSSGDGSTIKWWSLPQGTSMIRVLPPWDATGRVALEVYTHRIEYTEPGSRFTKYNWTCVNRTFGRPCNICQGLKEMRDAGISTDEWEANTRQFYINALVMSDPGWGRSPDALMPGTHVLMRIPKTVYDWIVTQITNPQIGDITDVQTGIDVMVTRSGSGLNTTYSCTMTPNGRQPIDPNILNTLELYNLSEIFNTGFEDQRISNLVSSLKASASHIGQAIPQVQQQMNIPQYQQPQQPVYRPPVVPAAPVPNMQTPNPPYQSPVMQQPQVQVPQYQQPMVTPPNPYNQPAIPPQIPQQVAPQQQVYQPPIQPQQPSMQPAQVQSATPPVQSQQSPAPVNQPANTPKCYGQYNPSDVNCITCPYEIDCNKSSK